MMASIRSLCYCGMTSLRFIFWYGHDGERWLNINLPPLPRRKKTAPDKLGDGVPASVDICQYKDGAGLFAGVNHFPAVVVFVLIVFFQHGGFARLGTEQGQDGTHVYRHP